MHHNRAFNISSLLPAGNGSNSLKSQAGSFESTKPEEVEGDASLPEAEQAVVCPIQVERRDGRGEVSETKMMQYIS